MWFSLEIHGDFDLFPIFCEVSPFRRFFSQPFFPGSELLQGLPDANGSLRGVARLRDAGGMVMGSLMNSGFVLRFPYYSMDFVGFYSDVMGCYMML